MSRTYIITSSPRTMMQKADSGKVYNLTFITDQSKIQMVNSQVDQSRLVGYHAYKIAEEKAGSRSLLHTTKLLVELQFDCQHASMIIADFLSELGLSVRASENETSLSQLAKGDRVSDWP